MAGTHHPAMPLYPIGVAVSHPETQEYRPPQPPLGPASPVPSTGEEQIPSSDFPALTPAQEGLKPAGDRLGNPREKTPRADVTALTQGNLPPPSSAPHAHAAGVWLGGGARSEARRLWNLRSRGIPFRPRHPAPVERWEIPGRGWSRPEWTPEVRRPTFKSQAASITATRRMQCHPSLGEGVRVTSSSFRIPGIRLPSPCTPTPKIPDTSLNV